MVILEILGNQNNVFMSHRLILKGTEFQLPTPKRLSTVVKKTLFLGGGGGACQTGVMNYGDFVAPTQTMKQK